jgi:hypothetical protein
VPCIGIRDGKVLITISKVFGDAFCEGIEQATKKDVIGGIHFGDGGVGGLNLQCSFYL